MKFLLTAFLFVAPFLAPAKEAVKIDVEKLKHPVKPALWKIEGKELTKPSYLFGTIHLGDPRITTLHPEAEKAFQASDHFYAEVDLDSEKQKEMITLSLREDGKTLTESIGPKITKELNAFLKGVDPNLSSKIFDPMKTWVILMTLPVLEIELAGKKPLDLVLFERAVKAGKNTEGVETMEDHLKFFNGLKEEEQIELLESALRTMKEEKAEGKNSVKKMVNLYLTSDIHEIGKMIKEDMNKGFEENEELGRRLIKALLDDRNLKMTQTIAGKLAQHPKSSHFFAIGTAHYTGPTAIQDLLTKKGYTITPAFK